MTDDDDGPPTKHEGQLISITSTPVATPTPRSTSRALSPSPPRRLATLGHLCWPGEWLASFRIVISITLAFVSPISSLSEYPFLDLPVFILASQPHVLPDHRSPFVLAL